MATAKITFFIICLSPFLLLLYAILALSLQWPQYALFDLGANPVEMILHETGDWALRFFLLSLAVTPIRKMFHVAKIIRFRRMIGLYGFFYLVCHFLVYLLLDLQLDFSVLIEDITDRPYITVGFAALLLSIPLAITSTHAMMRRLGKNWVKLHRAAYAISILGVLHFLWLVKKDLTEPMIYLSILVFLLGYRVYKKWTFTNKRVHAR